MDSWRFPWEQPARLFSAFPGLKAIFEKPKNAWDTCGKFTFRNKFQQLLIKVNVRLTMHVHMGQVQGRARMRRSWPRHKLFSDSPGLTLVHFCNRMTEIAIPHRIQQHQIRGSETRKFVGLECKADSPKCFCVILIETNNKNKDWYLFY